MLGEETICPTVRHRRCNSQDLTERGVQQAGGENVRRPGGRTHAALQAQAIPNHEAFQVVSENQVNQLRRMQLNGTLSLNFVISATRWK